MLDEQNALILDIGVGGAYVEHHGEPKVGDRLKLVIRWKGADADFICRVARTNVVRRAANGVVSNSALTFVQGTPRAGALLDDLLATLVGKILAAQKSNAAAAEDPDSAIALANVGAARRSRSRGFVSYHLSDDTWTREFTDSSAQPEDGFTVAAYEDEDELQTLCSAYATADEEGRRLIRMVADLSARSSSKK